MKQPLSRRMVALREIRAFLFLAYPGCVYAANNALGTQFAGYTTATVLIVVMLIGVGGMTGMLHRLKGEYDLYGELRHPKLFIATNLFGAVVAGVLVLLVGEGGGWPGWLLAIAILIAAFAGTLLIERAWNWAAAKYLPVDDGPKTGNFNGRVPPLPPRAPIEREGE